MFAAVAQLPGHVPAERDVPVHGPAEGGAQVQARHGVGDPGPGELGADGPARQVVVGRQAGATDGRRRQSPGQRDGHYTCERHVQRERGQPGVPRRAVRGRSGAVAVLRRAGAAPGGGQRSRYVGGVQVVGAQLTGHVLVAAAGVPVAQLRTGRAHSVRRLGLAGLRQRIGLRVHRQRVGHAQVAARRAGQSPARGAAEQHVHVPVSGPARRPRVDVLRELRSPEHRSLLHVQAVSHAAPDMGRRRHAAGRPLRHAQAVRTHRYLLVLGFVFGAAKRHAAEEAVHAGRELPVEVA